MLVFPKATLRKLLARFTDHILNDYITKDAIGISDVYSQLWDREYKLRVATAIFLMAVS